MGARARALRSNVMSDGGVAPVSFVHGRRTLYACATYAWTVAVVSATTAVLALDFHKPCDTPLKAWVIVFTAAVFCIATTKLLIGNETEFLSEEAERMWQEGEQRNQQRAEEEGAPPARWWPPIVHLQRVAYLIRRLCGYLLFVWFIAGVVWVFRASTCPGSAPNLWRLALAYLIALMATFALGIGTVCVVMAMQRGRELQGTGFGVEGGGRYGIRRRRRGLTAAEIERATTTRKFSSRAQEQQAQRQRGRDGERKEEAGRGTGAGAEEERQHSLQCCSICLCEFVADDTVRVLPCEHEFHDGCINQWLAQNRDCPLCKRGVVASDDATATAAAAAAADDTRRPATSTDEREAGEPRQADDSGDEYESSGSTVSDDGDAGRPPPSQPQASRSAHPDIEAGRR